MKWLLLLLALLLAPATASAQCSGVFPAGDVCGSTTGGTPHAVPFTSFVSTLTLTQYHFFIGNASNKATDTVLAGDCVYGALGIVCTKTNNVPFGTFATQSAPTGVANNCLQANTSGVVTGTGVACGGGGGSGGSTPQGRLTLTSHTPVMISSVSSSATLYYTQYAGNGVPYFTGSVIAADTIPSNQVSTVMASTGTGVLNAAGVFDVWWEGNTHHNICIATNGSGGGWASDTAGSNTARGTGYSQLDTTTQTFTTNANAVAHCYNGTTDYGSVAVNRLTYLGTIQTDPASAGVVSMNFGSAASGGGQAFLNIWNAYNREPMKATVTDSTTNWSYSGTNRVANNSTGNSIIFVSGQQISNISPAYGTQVNMNSTLGTLCGLGWQIDSSSSKARVSFLTNQTGVTWAVQLGTAPAFLAAQLGSHQIFAVESSSGNACLFFGGAGTQQLEAQFYQ